MGIKFTRFIRSQNQKKITRIIDEEIVREATQEEIEQESKDALTLIVFEQFVDDIVLFYSADGLSRSFSKAKLGKEFSIHKDDKAAWNGIKYHYYVKTPITHIYFFTKENAEQYLKTLLFFVSIKNN